MDLGIILRFLPDFWQGVVVTVQLSVTTIVIASVLGALLSALSWSGGVVVRSALNAFSWAMRCIPALIILFLAYYGLPQLGVRLDGFTAAVAGLSVQGAAYMMEIFKSGILGVPPGQFDAARALGIPRARAWIQLVGPQALRIAMPAYASDAIKILKGTSIASTITVFELTAAANQAISITYKAIEVLLPVAVVYALLSSIIILLQHLAERALDPGERRRNRRERDAAAVVATPVDVL
ncbi:amino acid ABC transporter permease [Microbacterium sp. 18062]|uniref:amino acid ABC transporter permease n=1 Tax=Microbacterium sp. 18062 TaxID=2681410 RepID=UPI00135C76E3|nr:amino acid ABC transporter permease [Microbacterium sp. 18062]